MARWMSLERGWTVGGGACSTAYDCLDLESASPCRLRRQSMEMCKLLIARSGTSCHHSGDGASGESGRQLYDTPNT